MSTGKRTDYISWDDYFMATAILSAKRSKDPSTQVGACIVDDNNRIVSIGYNGFPRNCDDDVFPWTKDGESPNDCKMFYVVHAEANALLNAINSNTVSGTRIYTTLFPCNECTKLLIQSGIKEVIYLSDKYSNKPSFIASRKMLDYVEIKCTRFIPQKNAVLINFDDWGSGPNSFYSDTPTKNSNV